MSDRPPRRARADASTPHALADTSVFVGLENGRFEPDRMPTSALVSVVTMAELRLGVLTAPSLEVRAKRLATLRVAESLNPLPIDDSVADAWATMVGRLREAGRKVPVNDAWIAATAIAHGIPIATQDADYDDLPGVSVIRL